ncbi:hypothetical protein AUJ84_01000 [Candidatus Pacearchaeota archaeon CG1_02_32_132]|nr:MAG: hypothetical protein AUJ84_01000 [Candidatus Pacearchaeota archaeon CG1_02_32_132]
MNLAKKTERFELKHQITSFLIIMLLTLLIARFIASVYDPNLIIKGFEIHHFYYGLILLIIISLIMLFEKGEFKINLIITAIAIGLIIDELILVGTEIKEPLKYNSTIYSVIILALAVVLIVEFISYILKNNKNA